MRYRGIKRILSVILCTAILLTASACGRSDTVITAAGIRVSKGIYSYYLGTALRDYAKDNAQTDPELKNVDQSQIRAAAENQCLTYALILEEFSSLELTMSYKQKTAVANRVATDWLLYGDYFKTIGLSKADYTKICEFEQYRDSVFLSYYSAGGEFEVSEEEIQTAFTENYVLFKTVVGYKTETDANGNSVRIDDSRSAALLQQFQQMASKISNGTLTFEQVKYQYNSETAVSDEAAAATTVLTVETPSIITKDNASYPEGFFNQVLPLEYNVPTVLSFEDYLYLVLRLNILEDGSVNIDDYREACLKLLRTEAFDKLISERKASLDIDKNESRIYSIKINDMIDLIFGAE